MSLLRSAWISVKQTLPNGGSGSILPFDGLLSGTANHALRRAAGLQTLPYRNSRPESAGQFDASHEWRFGFIRAAGLAIWEPGRLAT
jgi:hypothetical protein